MCTAVTYHTKDHYFGRTLDLEHMFRETVTVTPRHFPFDFRCMGRRKSHHALIGMATVVEGYPLYYEAANEHGLAMAGLNFPGNAHYFPVTEGKENIASFELIPWILCNCRDLEEAKAALSRMNLCDIAFSDSLPPSPLHWMIADKTGALTVECTQEGMKLFDNPLGVLTNNPPFDYQMTHLADFMHLSPHSPKNSFGEVSLAPYSRGMGGMGLPGDLSSASRFVRAAFVKLNSRSGESEMESISQFFHILGAVEQQRGCVQLENEEMEITAYSSCINMERGIYYYTTYENHCISAVNMHACDLERDQLFTWPLIKDQSIYWQNGQ